MDNVAQADKAKEQQAKPALVAIRAQIDRNLDREVERASFELDIPKRQIVEEALKLWLEQRRQAA